MPWYAKDTHYRFDPKIVRLGEQFGADALVVVDVLMAEAKLQGEGGRVSRAYRTLAHECFIEGSERVREIVAATAQSGVLIDLDEDGSAFTAAFPPATWERWQRNFRQQQHRDRKRDEQAKVTPDNDLKPKVTDRTVQYSTNSSSSAHAREVDPVLAILCDVAFRRSLTDPEVPAVAEIAEHFGSLASEAEAKKFRHYWTEGPGKSKSLPDVTWGWRRWLERVREPATPEQSKPKDRSAYAKVEPAA